MKKDQKVFNGAILMVTMRWSDRLIGLVSTLVLARLLVPDDFGIVAMATLVVAFIDVLLNLGVTQSLIHNKNADSDDYNTAWTLRFLQAALSAVIIFITAPLVADYFNNQSLTDVLRVMSLSVIIGSVENIGIVTFQKNLEFGKDFKYFFTKRVVGFLVTMAIAFYFKSYWAMIFGSMAGRLTGVILSYIMHTFRPSFSLCRLRELWSFSQWILFRNIGIYLDTSMDRILVGRRLDSNALGGYTVAGEVASLPTTELLAPLGRVLFPAFVDKRDEPKEFANRLSLAVGVQLLVAVPACLGLMIVAPDVVNLLLGEKWLFVIPLVQIIAIGNLIGAFAHSCGYALLALGKVKIQAYIIWLQAILFIVSAMLVGDDANAEKFATIRLMVVLIGSVLLIGTVLFQLRIMSLFAFLSPLVRPVLAASLMWLALHFTHSYFTELASIIRLGVEVLVGAIVYSSALVIMWLLVKKPEGAESYLFKNIKKFINKN